MFKLYLPTGRFGLGGSKISYLILVSFVRLGQFLSSALALTVTQKIRIRTGTVRSMNMTFEYDSIYLHLHSSH